MTSHLTKIALGTVAIFFVCMIAGAVMLQKSPSRDVSTKADGAGSATSSTTDETKPDKSLLLNDSGLDLPKAEEVDNINFYAGQLTTDDAAFKAGFPARKEPVRKPIQFD